MYTTDEMIDMEQNEEMTTDLTTVDLDNVGVESENEDSGLSTLAAMGIGAGITLLTVGAVKLVKKGISWVKAKKENSSKETDESGKTNQIEAEYREVPVEEVGENE